MNPSGSAVDAASVAFVAVRCDFAGREVGVAAFAAVVVAAAVAFAAVVAVAGIGLIDAEEIATAVGAVGSAVAVASFAVGCCYSVPGVVAAAAAFAVVAEPAAEGVVDWPSFADSFLAARRLLSPSALPVP